MINSHSGYGIGILQRGFSDYQEVDVVIVIISLRPFLVHGLVSVYLTPFVVLSLSWVELYACCDREYSHCTASTKSYLP